ncbi:MAG: glycosyltransferase family 39 protein [Candidatus Limimorpha sp.]
MKAVRKRSNHLRASRNKTSIKADYIILAGIMLVTAVLRLWRLNQIPFMHDEFSALFRTSYDNLHDLFTQGIIVDPHPAGVQFFLYFWVKMFGWSHFWVKLPFVLAGVGSIFLIYKIGRQWFNSKTGLFAAAFFAVSQFTLFYSQVARPYAPGLFFVLLQAYFWYKIVFDPRKPSIGTCVWFAIASWLAAIMHSFSTAQAGLIFLTGLFFLPKERRKPYWLSGLGAVVFYSPNIPIFYQQLIVSGSIGGWLGKPTSSFLGDFIQYTMNYSSLFMFSIGIFILLPLILAKRNKRKSPMKWIPFVWFAVVFGIAFAYSLLREPILQQSTLIFCYPFIIISAFSLYKNNTTSIVQTAILVVILLFVGINSLIIDRKHFDLMYHQGFDQIAVEMEQDNATFSDMRFATHSEAKKVPEFYQAKTGITHRSLFDLNNSIADFRSWLESDSTAMLGFGWTDWVDVAWEVTAVAAYPNLINEHTWFTSKYLTLSKSPIKESRPALKAISGSNFRYDHQEWGASRYIGGDSIPTETDIFGIVVDFSCYDTVNDCILVIELHDRESDSLLFWRSSRGDDGCFPPGRHSIANGFRFEESKLAPQDIVIKTYIWNRGLGLFDVEKYSYYMTKKNPALTGLYTPLR